MIVYGALQLVARAAVGGKASTMMTSEAIDRRLPSKNAYPALVAGFSIRAMSASHAATKQKGNVCFSESGRSRHHSRSRVADKAR